MVDAIVSVAIGRLATILEEKIGDEINLVRGVKKELLYLSSELTTIRKVLEDAETRRYKEKTIQHWLKELEDISYDVDDVLDEWKFAILKHRIEGSEESDAPQPGPKACSFVPSSCFSFKRSYADHRYIAVKIEGLKERLQVIVNEKDRYDFVVKQPAKPQGSVRVQSVSSVNVLNIHGRDAEKDALVRKLISVDQKDFFPTVISIVGTGGIGKTTLAQLAYNDPQVINTFQIKIWICVSNVFNEVKIAKGIVDQIGKESCPSNFELEALLKCVERHISGERFLLVLDDVWTEDYTKWEPFRNSLERGGRGSKILVTTRNERVSRVVGTTEIHCLGLLSDTECWLVMRQMAFSGRSEVNCEELEEIGETVAKKCKGLPLAAKFLGSLLCFKDSAQEWDKILHSEIWQLEEAEVNLFPHLFLSYNELSPLMKRCFSHCAIFPKDFEIDEEKLIGMWMALGYLSSNDDSTGELELRGKEYFDNLRMRCFFQNVVHGINDRVVYKMHDIVHDFAQFLKKTSYYNLEDTEIDSSSIFQVKVYRSLFCEVQYPNPSPLDSATSLRVLTLEWRNDPSVHEERKLELPQGMDKLIHLRYLALSSDGMYLLYEVPQIICKLYNLQRLDLRGMGLKELSSHIGNLINLRHLNLDFNEYLSTLPPSVYKLLELRTLSIAYCDNVSYLPKGIDRLKNLRQFNNHCTPKLNLIPQGFEHLTGLRTLRCFYAGSDWSQLGSLNKLNQLSGSLDLFIHLSNAEDVVQAKKANLRKKKHIQDLTLEFTDLMSAINDDNELLRNELMEALQPPPYLQRLTISKYLGTKFPGWITSSLNHLRVLTINNCMTALSYLGELPSLEELHIWEMRYLDFVDRRFLGIPPLREIETGVVIRGGYFPKLQILNFAECPYWYEWKDITDEEAHNDNLSIMPCLRELRINHCRRLKALPHCLLRKASALEHLNVRGSFRLWKCYKDKDGSAWRSLSHIPHVEVNQ